METHPFDCEQLIAYAAGDLDAAAAEAVEKHLRGCAECAGLVRHYRLIRSIVLEDDTQAPPATTLARAQALFQPRKRALAPLWLHSLLNGPPLARGTLLAVCVLAIALAFGGARAVAQQTKRALPGDTLYPVKTAWEDAHVAVTLDNAGKVQVQLSMAETRVNEMQTLVALGRYDLVPFAAKNFEDHIQSATAALGQAARTDPVKKVELAKKVETDLVQYTQALTSLQKTTPTEVKPAIEHAVRVSDAVQTNVREQLSAPMAPTPLPATAIPPATLTPSATDTSTPPATNTFTPSATDTPLPTNTPLPAPTNTAEPAPTNTSVPAPTATRTPPPTATGTPLPTATSTLRPTMTATPLPTATSVQLTVSATLTPASTPTPAPTTLTATQATSLPPTPTSSPPPSNTPLSPNTSTPAPTGTAIPGATSTGTPAALIVITTTVPSTTPVAATVTVIATPTPTPAPRSEEIAPVGMWWDATRIETQGTNGLTETSGFVGETIRTRAPNAEPVSSADSAACVSFDPLCARGLMPIFLSTCVASGGLALGMFAALRRLGSE